MVISKEDIKSHLLTLKPEEQSRLMKELQDLTVSSNKLNYDLSRRKLLNNKQGSCPHCGYAKYVRYGIDKGGLNDINVNPAKGILLNILAHGLHDFKERIRLMSIWI